MDAMTKLQSKKYADSRRGAKYSNISAGDIVLMAMQKKGKTDPQFSDERFTVLSRDGAKVVVRSDRGVQYTRSVNDLKPAPMLSGNIGEQEHTAEGHSVIAADRPDDATDVVKKTAARPARNVRKPERFNDMCLYYIFQ